jgi:hypothetical protein
MPSDILARAADANKTNLNLVLFLSEVKENVGF